ncbi:MAG: autotransporter outer membrane beta-barrel domain-containing protein [Hyphomicrobium sp.]
MAATPALADFPRDGCASISFFDTVNLQNVGLYAMVEGFSIGNRLSFTVSGQDGEFHLVNGAQDIVLSVGLTSTPQTVTFTVSTASDTHLEGVFAVTPGTPTMTVTASCAGPASSGKDASQDVVKGFLAARINGILLNDPGATSLLNRSNSTVPTNIASAGNGTTNVASSAATFGNAMGLGSGLGNAMGLGARSAGDDTLDTTGGKSIQFSQSLSQMRRQAAQSQMTKDRMALGAGDGLPLAYQTASPWDIWVEGRYSAFDDDAGNLDRDGHVGVLYLGGDYRVAQNMIVGALAQFDWSKDDSSALDSTVDGNGWMIGPYLSMQVHENIYFDLRAAWGRSTNDLTLGTTNGTFDTTRWLVKGTLAGNWRYDAWRITPSAELAYVEESADAFTNSAGVLVPSQTVSLGRLQFGPEFGYRFAHTADTFIEPFAAIRGVWDFDNPNVAIIDGFVVGPGDFWGRLEGGLNVMTSGGTYVRGSASWDGVGASDYSGYTLQGTVNVPLN